MEIDCFWTVAFALIVVTAVLGNTTVIWIVIGEEAVCLYIEQKYVSVSLIFSNLTSFQDLSIVELVINLSKKVIDCQFDNPISIMLTF